MCNFIFAESTTKIDDLEIHAANYSNQIPSITYCSTVVCRQMWAGIQYYGMECLQTIAAVTLSVPIKHMRS